MGKTNTEIVNKAANNTTNLANGGLLNPEQAKRFITQTFEKTVLGGLIRHEQHIARSGEIDKIGIDRRILRAKTEDVDDGYRATVKHGKLLYQTTETRLPWEITENALRENIQGQSYEATITDLMTTQLGIDREDLLINGDTAVASTDPDYDFLKQNDGWIKLIKAGGHTIDRSAIDSGALADDVFYKMLLAMPNKFIDNNLRWMMAPSMATKWEEFLVKQARTSGGAVTDGMINNPAKHPILSVPNFPVDSILLVNPKNLIVVDTHNVIIRKTTEGKEAIYKDKRFYVVHFDFDALVEELDATVLAYGLA